MTFSKVDQPKSELIKIRVTPELKAEITQKARDCNLSVSEFALRAIEGRQTRTQHDSKLILELREMMLLLKEIYQGEKPREASELQPVLDAVVRNIDRIGVESRIVL